MAIEPGRDANSNPCWVRGDVYYPFHNGTESRLAFCLAQTWTANRFSPLPVVAIGDDLAVQSLDGQRTYILGRDDQPHLLAARLRYAIDSEREMPMTEPTQSTYNGRQSWVGASGTHHTYEGPFQSRFARLLAQTYCHPFPFFQLWLRGEGGHYVVESKTDSCRYVIGATPEEIEVNLPCVIREDRKRNARLLNDTWLAQATNKQ